MAHIVLLHSVLGLRPAERAAADRLHAAGHEVTLPDLYDGEHADDYADGFALRDRVGWDTAVGRATDAVRAAPAGAVLAGVSMGAGVVSALLPDRPDTGGVLLLHGTAAVPAALRPGLPVQLHVSEHDRFAPPAEVAAWRDTALDAGADVEVHTYDVPGHYFTDPGLPEYDADAAALTWRRSLEFLAGL